MAKLDRTKAVVLLLIISLIIFAVMVIMNADTTFIYLTLVWIIALMFIGVFAYEVEEQV